MEAGLAASGAPYYAFLGAGGIAFLSGFRWPAPASGAPGAWVEAGVDASPEVVRAIPVDELPWWFDDELWELELDGPPQRAGRAVHAPRARLLRRVEAWNEQAAAELVEACATRVRETAVAALRAAGREEEAEALERCADLEELERAGDALAGSGDGEPERLAGFAADVVLYARDAADPVRAAAVAAYVAAHALAGGDKTVTSYEARFEDERRWQVTWLRSRLSL